MRIGDVARASGVSVRALRYYEEQGLLLPERTASGQRVYDETTVEKVAFFQDMFAAGLSSANIAALLPCIDSGHTTEEQRAMLSSEHDRLRQRIRVLQAATKRLRRVMAIAAERSEPAAA